MNRTDAYVDDLISNPGCYESTVDEFVQELRNFKLSDSAILVIVDKVYEMVILFRNLPNIDFMIALNNV